MTGINGDSHHWMLIDPAKDRFTCRDCGRKMALSDLMDMVKDRKAMVMLQRSVLFDKELKWTSED